MSTRAVPEGKYADVGEGLRVHYQEQGTGPAVLFLHGSGPGASGYSNFRRNYPVFAEQGFRVVVPDTLGFGALHDFPIRVDPQGTPEDNSTFRFIGADKSSYIIFGRGGVDDAEDADVLVHEYGHALSNAASPSSNVGFERTALDEGRWSTRSVRKQGSVVYSRILAV